MPSGGRSENCWGISCEKSRLYAKKSYFFQFYRGARCAPTPWVRPCMLSLHNSPHALINIRNWSVKDKKIHEARAFNFTYRYIDDVLSINSSRFAEFLPLIYPPELEVKETTDTASSASFLDIYLEFDDSGQLNTKIYDKRDDFNFKIINFPNMCSNIPASPAYGVYISQLIRYARASSNYSDFLKRHLHLRNRLLDQGYKKIRLIRSLKKLYSDTNILSKYIPSLQKKL